MLHLLVSFEKLIAVIIGRWMSNWQEIMRIGKTVFLALIVKLCGRLDPAAGWNFHLPQLHHRRCCVLGNYLAHLRETVSAMATCLNLFRFSIFLKVKSSGNTWDWYRLMRLNQVDRITEVVCWLIAHKRDMVRLQVPLRWDPIECTQCWLTNYTSHCLGLHCRVWLKHVETLKIHIVAPCCTMLHLFRHLSSSVRSTVCTFDIAPLSHLRLIDDSFWVLRCEEARGSWFEFSSRENMTCLYFSSRRIREMLPDKWCLKAATSMFWLFDLQSFLLQKKRHGQCQKMSEVKHKFGPEIRRFRPEAGSPVSTRTNSSAHDWELAVWSGAFASRRLWGCDSLWVALGPVLSSSFAEAVWMLACSKGKVGTGTAWQSTDARFASFCGFNC